MLIRLANLKKKEKCQVLVQMWNNLNFYLYCTQDSEKVPSFWKTESIYKAKLKNIQNFHS